MVPKPYECVEEGGRDAGGDGGERRVAEPRFEGD